MSRFSKLKKYLPFIEASGIYLRLKMRKYSNLKISKLKHPFSIRSNAYDYATFEEVILEEAYNISLAFEPRNIIDGGGNIGLTAIFLSSKYPDATIISLEPDKENFKLLQQNAQAYKNIQSINMGIWNKQTNLLVKDEGQGNNGFFVVETDEVSNDVIPSVSIYDIMKKMNWKYIDILKLDVEGAEKEIFSSGYQDWLPKTKVLIIELHDRIKAGCSKAVLSAVSEYDFSLAISGENLVFTNQANL